LSAGAKEVLIPVSDTWPYCLVGIVKPVTPYDHNR